LATTTREELTKSSLGKAAKTTTQQQSIKKLVTTMVHGNVVDNREDTILHIFSTAQIVYWCNKMLHFRSLALRQNGLNSQIQD